MSLALAPETNHNTELLHRVDAYWRAANYLSVSQIFLRENPLLKRRLEPTDIKHMLLGHWGTAPGQNFIYVHPNRVIKKCDLDMIYISCPGHGGPAVVAQKKIRVVNVIDLMRLQPPREHPHGLSDIDFDNLFTTDKPAIFAYHAYSWLIHRLTYRRTNHENIHVRGYKEEGTITTPFDMTVLNDLDRFHLVMNTIDRVPTTGDAGVRLKKHLTDKLIEHRQYINEHGQDLPEIRNWKWCDQ